MSSTAQDIYKRIREQQDNAEQQQRLTVANELQVDYSRAQRVFAVQANTKLPYEVVDADLENLEDKLKKSQFNYEQYTDQVNGAPAFNRFVSENPYHLSVLQRDHKDLSAMERAYRRMSLGWQSGWAMTEIAEIRDRQLTNFENPDNEADKKRLEVLSRYTEVAGTYAGADNWFAKLLVGTANQVPIQAWLLGESLDDIAIGTVAGAGIGAATGAGAGGVGALPGAGVGAVTGFGRGFLVGRTEAAFRLERGLAYDEYLGMGLNEEEARWAATAVGGVNAALESIGMGAVFKRIPGFDKVMNDRVGGVINSVLTKPTMRQAVARATLQYGEGVATELVTEVFQEATLIAAGEILKSHERERGNRAPEMEAMGSDEFWDRVGDIAVHTLYGVGLIGAAGPTARLMKESRQAYNANRFGTVLDRLGEAAENSETRKNVPTMWKKFVERISSDNETVLVDKEGFVEYFQTQGMDPEQVAGSLGVKDLADQMADPAVGDLAIPARQYLEKVAPSPHHKGLEQDIRQKPGVMTIREATIVDNAKPAAIKAIEEAAEKVKATENEVERSELINQVKQQLIEAGTSPDAAENQKWIMAGLHTLAGRMGMQTQELANEYYAGVIAETSEDPAKDVDIMVDPYLDALRGGTVPTQRDIFGPSLIDMLKRRGGLAPDSELEARDVKKQIRGIIKDAGDTLDGAAEIAAEQGFIAERDPELLLEAIEREMGGEDVFGNLHVIDEDARKLRDTLEELGRILDQAGIDLQDLTNPQVRAAMAEMDVYDQLDETDVDIDSLDELTKTAVTSAEHDPVMLTKIAAMIPELALTQDFGDVKLRRPGVYGGKKGTRVSSAQKEFDKTVKRKGILDKLMDCING